MTSAVRRVCEALLVSAACAALSALPAQSSGAAKQPPPPELPAFEPVPTTFEALFAERDARAQDVLGYQRCIEATVTALRAGVLGGVDRGWSLTCLKQGTEWRGIFGELMDAPPGMRVRVQYALRDGAFAGTAGRGAAGRGMVVRDPVDTARAAGTARALLRGLAATARGTGVGQFVPVTLPQKNFVEVWFVPSANTPSRAIVGGDSVIQMSADGTRELGHARSAPRVRVLTIPSGATTYTLDSSEPSQPLLTELMLAHLAIDQLPELRVRTRAYDAILTRSTRRWTFVKR